MKPNGKYSVVRAVLLVLCMAGLFTAMANAETAHGKFKLTTETRWGKMLLAPGEYEFTLNTNAAGAMVTIRSEGTGWSGMILPVSISDPAAERIQPVSRLSPNKGAMSNPWHWGTSV